MDEDDAVLKRREIVRNSMRRHRAMNNRVLSDLQAQVEFLERVYEAKTATALHNRDARFDRLTASTQFLLHQNAMLLEALRRRAAMNQALLRTIPRLTDMPSLLYDNEFIQSHLSVFKSTLLSTSHLPPSSARVSTDAVDGWESQVVKTQALVKYSSVKVCRNMAAPTDVVWREMWTKYCNVQIVRLVDMDTVAFEAVLVDQATGRTIPRILVLHRFQHGSASYIGRVVLDKAAIGRGPPVYHINLLGLEGQSTQGEMRVTSKGVISLDLVHPLYAQAVLAQNALHLRTYESNALHDPDATTY
ncbi:hypothetical protein, variant [Aphanomyces invadans]|uniref:Uncharacterized protein n=1 Tax=Aphanomyces invadans TaxID=157072 RepID=A0A024U5F6_9STRA|nr:hypothetical protein, variant [Aphanomyces invadans]ETW01651.1 hypothetical protein, variant [Aphanomyces invadans]|eukprot:XP_008869499.1 hypothetical protein, variant [Aphanomyces invadans]